METWRAGVKDRQTEGGMDGGWMEDSWKALGLVGGCTWMIVSFVQASSVANGEIAQISSFHVLCFWCGANLSAWPKLKRPIFTLFTSLSLCVQFSVPLSSFSVSQRLVESYFKPLMLNVGTRFFIWFLTIPSTTSCHIVGPYFPICNHNVSSNLLQN